MEDCPDLRANEIKELNIDQEVGGEHICLPPDYSRIDGPNGSHLFFVYSVLGPRECMLKEFEDPDKTLRKIAFQAVQAMVTLHSHGICHGGQSLDKGAGVGSDLWAFGCTLFEIRTDRKLFCHDEI